MEAPAGGANRERAGAPARKIMSTAQVVVEQQGSHYVAWMRAEDGKPKRSVVMVGQTAGEAEARLRAWFAAHPDE